MHRRARRTAAVRREYARCALGAGPLTRTRGRGYQVRFRSVLSPGRRIVLVGLLALAIAMHVVLIGWLLLPDHVPGPGAVGVGEWRLSLARVSYCSVILVEVIRLVHVTIVGFLTWHAKDPVPVTPARGLRVAVLTTIVPSKEPIEVLARTL